MKNDVPGIGYFVAAFVYSLIACWIYGFKCRVLGWWAGHSIPSQTLTFEFLSKPVVRDHQYPMNAWTDASCQPVVGFISKNDLQMKAAYQRAAETLPDFIEHIKASDGRFCAAKLCFKDPDESERLGADQLLYWWLSFASYDAEKSLFSAEFVELPKCLKPYHHIGQRLWFEGEEIFDWYANADGRLYGGFTIRVARSRIPNSELADYDQYIGVAEWMEETAS